MSTLSDKQIKELVASGHLVIRPFDPATIQPASYDLRIGPRILASPLGPDILGAVIELNDQSPSYKVQTGQMVAVISSEWLELPLDICARFGIRSEFARRGLHAFGGVQIDPGFKGYLIMSHHNVGPEPITLTLAKPFYTVEFEKLDEPASFGYAGEYQNQVDFPQDQYKFILSARTTSLAEIPTLRREVARLSVLIEELEEKLPDPDEGLRVRRKILTRLQRSSNRPRDDLISADDMERRLGLRG